MGGDENIADKIIAQNDKAQKSAKEVDEFGLPLAHAKNLEYLVARIFARNPDIYLDEDENKLYIGRRQVDESARSAVELADHYNDWCKGNRWPMIFNRVKHLAPRLDKTKLYIADNLLWDIEKQELVVTDKKIKGV